MEEQEHTHADQLMRPGMEFWKIQQNDPPRVRWKGRVIFDPEGNCAPEELPEARFPRKIGVEGQDGSEEGSECVCLVFE